jgi:hypothetical protein
MRYLNASSLSGVQVSSDLKGVGRDCTAAVDEAGLGRARERRTSVLSRVLPLEAVEAIDAYLNKLPVRKNENFCVCMRFFKFASMTGLRI